MQGARWTVQKERIVFSLLLTPAMKERVLTRLEGGPRRRTPGKRPRSSPLSTELTSKDKENQASGENWGPGVDSVSNEDFQG
mmetsp:Transcript_17324/g.26813  ORF Transcript_17324/g.26813 Transcript_17324/m.26813 type:complete len:82 (+) Transcript_17324:506-751(+)